MKSSFYIYSNSIKKVPKGLMIFIILFLLVLIPLILSLLIVGGVLKLVGKSIGMLLPKTTKKPAISTNDSGVTIIDITPNSNSLN